MTLQEAVIEKIRSKKTPNYQQLDNLRNLIRVSRGITMSIDEANLIWRRYCDRRDAQWIDPSYDRDVLEALDDYLEWASEC